ncbi:MAG: copper resistance protein CopD [Candidatus Thioglobus sp.]|nr:copper resistance protein CopD [Candidatus Thioglobus sp.]|tara:strand:+ start:5059 stop:5505 length:447 start_codon:yes stop_codon:yes gene_type:complete
MTLYSVLLFLHVLAATIWTGGHLVLSLVILPRVLSEKSPGDLLKFESAYERIGIPALLIQVTTGVWLSYRLIPNLSHWFKFDNPINTLIGIKIILLSITVAFAIDARLRIIPNLSKDNLVSLAWHIVPVTVTSVLFVFVGVTFRTGWS